MMDGTTKKIVSLLRASDHELQLSTIRVLSELGIKDRSLVKAIGEMLGKIQDSVIKDAILEIPIRSPSKDYLPFLIPFFSDMTMNRDKVIRAVSAVGASAIPQLTKRYPKAMPFEKRSILAALSKISHRGSYQLLLKSLVDSREVEHLKFVCDLLRAVIEQMSKPDRKWMTKTVIGLLKKPQIKKVNSLTISCLILLSYLQDLRTKSILMSVLNQRKDIYITKYALIAMSRLGLKGKGHDDVVKALLPILNHNDFANVVKYALLVVDPIDISKRLQPQISKLLQSVHSSVRSYALSKLGSFNSSENVSTLIEYLNSPDIRIRDAAKASLEKIPKAVAPLLKLFEGDLAPEKTDQIINVLKAHRKVFKPAICKKLLALMQKYLKVKNDKHRRYLQLLKAINPDLLYKSALATARKLKMKSKWNDAIAQLALLQDSYLYTNEARYEMAVLSLKTSRQDLSIGSRDQDKALQLLQTLIKNNSDELFRNLTHERILNAQDLYYIGFHFSEKLFDLREFGIRILKHQIKKHSYSGVSKLAKRKLASVGSGSGHAVTV